jgi:hypothetical protein
MKCTTSPNDFAIDSFKGIPDSYDGRVLSKRHMYTGNMPTLSATDDTYIVLLPTPGVAFWYGQRTGTANMTLTPVYYSDFTTLFPAAKETSVVNNFRYASNVIEIVPTVNSMTWAGAIEVWKFTPQGGLTIVGAAANYYQVSGVDALDSVKPQSVLPFNHGMYAITAAGNTDYDFNQVLQSSAPANISGKMTTGTLSFGGANNIIGFGRQEAVVIKIPAGAATTTNTALIRTWACVEYQVTSSSLLYEYSHMSPPEDTTALQLVRRFIHSQPAAVPYYDNDSFWRTFMSWVRDTSGQLKIVPGVIGEVADAVNMVSKIALR